MTRTRGGKTSRSGSARHRRAWADDPFSRIQYGVFFAAGGHAALLDFPTAVKLQKIASTIYKDGGIVSAVCHGPAIIAGLDPEVIKGKKVTGFTKK